MISRETLIYSDIRAWLTANQRTAKWLANEVGLTYQTLLAVFYGRSKGNPKAIKEIVRIIGSDPWVKLPIVPYPKQMELEK